MGRVYVELAQYDKVKDLLEQAFIINKTLFSVNHPYVAWIGEALGHAHIGLGNYETAIRYLKQGLIVYENNYDEDNLATARILKNLGDAYFLKGDLKSGEYYFNSALKTFHLYKHPSIYMPLEGLAELYGKKAIEEKSKGNIKQSKNFETQSLNYLKQALEIVKAHFPKDSPHIARIQAKLHSLERQNSPNFSLGNLPHPNFPF